ncbi:MAG: protein-export chaperone SecB [Porticoccaceae bacterium]|nr:protein-export chaperone SecB [Porticoccaceae bacterium]
MNQATSAETGDGLDQGGKTQLGIKRVYVKDISFEVPLGVEAFTRQWQPRVNQDISTAVHKLADNQYEVVLHITISVEEEEQVLCLAEVQQAGIFFITGVEGQQLAQVLNTHCPGILFPYAREMIDNLVVRGTFPALMLPPVDFDAMFQKALLDQNQSGSDDSASQQPEKLN